MPVMFEKERRCAVVVAMVVWRQGKAKKARRGGKTLGFAREDCSANRVNA